MTSPPTVYYDDHYLCTVAAEAPEAGEAASVWKRHGHTIIVNEAALYCQCL